MKDLSNKQNCTLLNSKVFKTVQKIMSANILKIKQLFFYCAKNCTLLNSKLHSNKPRHPTLKTSQKAVLIVTKPINRTKTSLFLASTVQFSFF